MHLRLSGFVATTLLASSALAGVGKVSSPEVKKGVAEIEYSGSRSSDNNRRLNNRQSHTYEMEYGFTDRFMVGVEAQSQRNSSQSNALNGYGLEAQYVLTKQKNGWLNTAIKGEYLHALRGGDADEAEIKLLLSRRDGKWRSIANLNASHEIGQHRAPGIALSSRLQSSYALTPHYQPGFEWHADYGMLNDLGNAGRLEHLVGPMLRGNIIKTGPHEVDYQAGYYWGLTSRSPAQSARLQFGYAFTF